MLPRRLHHLIARLALAWFALALGVAAASPLVQPRAMQLVCSAEGGVKLMPVQPGEGGVDVGTHQLDCALCLIGNAPPPPRVGAVLDMAPLMQAPATAYADAPRHALAAAPLPARGPPLL